MAVLSEIRARYEALRDLLDERQLRLWAGAEAKSLGPEGVSRVAQATGLSRARVRRGLVELNEAAAPEAQTAGAPTLERSPRIRRPGAGRPQLMDLDPTLLRDLDALLEPRVSAASGHPPALRWTTRSKVELAHALRSLGHQASPTLVGRMLTAAGYRMDARRRKVTPTEQALRAGHFLQLNHLILQYVQRGLPILSIHLRRQEQLPQTGSTTATASDSAASAWVSVGLDMHTTQPALGELERWWHTFGKDEFKGAKQGLLLTQPTGAQAARTHVWSAVIDQFQKETSLSINHQQLPRGTYLFTRVKHRMTTQVVQRSSNRFDVRIETTIEVVG